MAKREINEQLNSLSFDMDEEIDDRNERRGRKAAPPRHAHTPMDPSHAIILAAIIIVGGLWGGSFSTTTSRNGASRPPSTTQPPICSRPCSKPSKTPDARRQRCSSEQRLRKRPENSGALSNSPKCRQSKHGWRRKNASNHPSASSGGSNTIRILRRNPHRGRPNLVENY